MTMEDPKAEAARKAKESIRVLKESQLRKLTDGWTRMGMRPNPGCKHCHGRGTRGYNSTFGQYKVCKCVKRRPIKKVDDD